jgi:hypothetical protein
MVFQVATVHDNDPPEPGRAVVPVEPDELLRKAADCLSRRDLRTDPMPILHERNTFGTKNPTSFFSDRPGPGLEPVGGEFQPQFKTVPGGGTNLVFEPKRPMGSISKNIVCLTPGLACVKLP